ncbi:MAG TPA: GNAT family N-acetyltransferase [Tepidisphaeraceae bacterium]|nr:GNAT family N-acetyltransferase [Tepidisphaeraceae bacterium]
MALFPTTTVRLRDGRVATIRHGVALDAPGLFALNKAVVAEDAYKLFTREEVDDVYKNLDRDLAKAEASPDRLQLVAVIGGEVVGELSVDGGKRERVRHIGKLGVALRADARGVGLGAAMLRSAIAWASAHPCIEKLSLCVHATNARAVALYRKMGFEVEGTRRGELRYGPGRYVDDHVMAMWVKPRGAGVN